MAEASVWVLTSIKSETPLWGRLFIVVVVTGWVALTSVAGALAADTDSAPGSAAPTAGGSAPSPADASAPGEPAPSASATGSPNPATGSAGSGAASYTLKLREIEERVNELKEKIFQSKARLIQLQEVVLHGVISGAKAVVVHKNEMSSAFKLVRVQYALDGTPILNRVDSGNGDLADAKDIEVFNGAIAPGNHQVSVFVEYQGGGYGIFDYLEGYKFKMRSSYSFTAEEGKLTTVEVVGFEQGGFFTEYKDRPGIRYDIQSAKAQRDGNVAPAESPSTGSSNDHAGGQ